MLELFFDNEKSFSVFQYLIESDSTCFLPSDIGKKLKISPKSLRRILNNFEILGIVNIEDPFIISLNIDNPIVQGICILDDLVEKYYMETSDESKENGFKQVLNSVPTEEMTLEDFVNLLK